MSETLAYAGLKVVDASQGLAGPGAALLLAQHGANVIKVEPPEGDWARRRGLASGDFSTLSIASNVGKRSIALDLKNAAGATVLRRLLASADVFIESFRPGVMARLGFDHVTLCSTHPTLIYASISGFGQRGPLRERPAIDSVMQAYSGLMSVNAGEIDGMPHRIGFWPVDVVTGLYAFQAIAVALYARHDKGCGRHIDCSLLQSALALQSLRLTQYAAGGDGPMVPTSCPLGTYRTADGWINLTVSEDRHWPLFCRAIGRAALADDVMLATAAGRIAQHQEVNAMVAAALATQNSDAWCAAFAAIGVVHERVRSYADVLNDAQVAAIGALDWIDQPGLGRLSLVRTPGLPHHHENAPPTAPAIGEHSVDILRELDYLEIEIDQLLRSGAVSAPGN